MDSVIIVCAGSATRSGLNYNKIFYPVGKQTVIDLVIEKFKPIGQIILCANKNDIITLKTLYPDCIVIEGGQTRTESVKNGLKAAVGSEIVAIHDAARPFVTKEVIIEAINCAKKFGSGIPAIKSTSAVCLAEEDIILQSLNRDKVYLLQTPQCYKYDLITKAYSLVDGIYADDSEVFRLAGFTPRLTKGCNNNIKLTNPSDFLDFTPLNSIGSGFDVHPLVEGRRLILGGVNIPFEKGLYGHSDADVLLHALTDAVLSAANQPDIGVLFPDTDSYFKDIDSFLLLDKAMDLLNKAHKKIIFISGVIIAQQPKLASYIPQIRKNIADRIKIDVDKINISATTTEFLGIVGQGKAIASSVAILCA